jgi:anthranilate phosphoribosyltransferase
VIGKVAKDFKEGVEIARSAIKEEKSRKKLAELIYYCGDKAKLTEAEKKFIYS